MKHAGYISLRTKLSHCSKAMEITKAFDFAVAIELDEGVFVNRLTPTVERIAKIVEHPIPAVVDIEELFDRKECCQLCFYIDDEMEQQVMPLLPNLSLSRWHPLFADVNLAGISKATGLSAFADYYGIDAAHSRLRDCRTVKAIGAQRFIYQ